MPLTVRLTVVECCNEALVPVVVMVYVPAGGEVEVVIVRVDEFFPWTEAGLNCAVAPAGNPLTLSATTLLISVGSATLTVTVAVDPAVTDCDDGVALIVNIV